jgi:cobalt-zinc-cadmium efflux system membrane fusion protein
MSMPSRISLRWPVLVMGAVAFVALGAATAYVLRPADVRPAVQPSPGQLPGPTTAAPPSDAAVTLSREAVERAGIVVATVAAGRAAGAGLRAPGVVEPNAYRTVLVTPLVSGRVTRVTAELGDAVRQGESMAQVFSPELAEAQTRYVSERAELGAHEQELARTEALVKIGAASREELERVHAAHTARGAAVQTAASRLELLGMPSDAMESLGPGRPIVSLTDVPAPIDGIVTERAANVGVNVDRSTKLFTVVDLSVVWIIAEIYERDFGRVRVGSAASVTTAADAVHVLRGRVSYIDPQVNAETRTARVRVEVPNAGQRLRLGMYAEVWLEDEAGAAAPLIPRQAVQQVGGRTVVYLADSTQPGRFIEREVRLGAIAGERVSVVAGLQVGDAIVTDGSFHVRAERERLGMAQRQDGISRSPGPSETSRQEGQTPSAQNVTVTVGEQGFEPARLTVRAGVGVRLTFIRTTDATCATEVVFPSLGIRRSLPLKEPVVIELTPAKTGEVGFVCGMDMLKGAVVVAGS